MSNAQETLAPSSNESARVVGGSGGISHSRVQLKQAASSQGGYDAQAAMLAPVQRRGMGQQAGALDLSAGPVQRRMTGDEGSAPATQEQEAGAVQQRGGRAVQRRAIQRLETPPTVTPTTETPATETPSTETPSTEPVEPFTGPRTAGAYQEHLMASAYGARITAVKTRGAEYQAKVAEGVVEAQTLKAKLGIAAEMRKEFTLRRDELDKKAKKAAGRELVQQEGIEAGDGKTMAKLLEEAKVLAESTKDKGDEAMVEKNLLEGILHAAVALAKQIDEDGFDAGRGLYVEIDKVENPRLIADANSKQMPLPEQAELAVNYRNWLRSYWRDDVMTDRDLAEIMYQRDLGKTGQKEGMSFEDVIKKTIADLAIVDPEVQKAALAGDATLGTPQQEQLDAIYAEVIASAARTNGAVTGDAPPVLNSTPRPT